MAKKIYAGAVQSQNFHPTQHGMIEANHTVCVVTADTKEGAMCVLANSLDDIYPSNKYFDRSVSTSVAEVPFSIIEEVYLEIKNETRRY